MVEFLPIAVRANVVDLLNSAARNRPVLAGVSGGRDSMLLLHLLVQGGFKKITVVHLNHGLRGRESVADARFVEKAAVLLGCNYGGGKVDLRRIAEEKNIGMEEAGRIARWDLFSAIARTTGARVLFLGHHADDRVETLLHHLFRGSGLSGASALRPDRSLTMNRLRLRVLRPLLYLQRAEISLLVTKLKIRFREDKSNLEGNYTRNRFRHRILPFLEKEYGRSIRATLSRTARILEAEDDWMEEQTAAVMNHFPKDELETRILVGLPLALRRRVIRRWLKAGGGAETGFAEIEAVCAMLKQGAAAKINLPGGLHARRRAGRIFLERGNCI